MTISPAAQGIKPGPVLAAIGGLATIAQALFAWQEFNPGAIALGTNGADYGGGKLILLLGVAVLVMALSCSMRGGSRRLFAWIAVAGLATVLVGLTNYLSIQGNIDAFNRGLAGAPFGLNRGLSLAVGPGLYLAIGGGVASVLGGIIGLVKTAA